MKINKFEIIDRCLYWKFEDVLIVGDIHLGYEESLNLFGINLPFNQFKETYELFERVFSVVEEKRLNKIILLGDVKHYFKGVLKSEFKDFYDLISLFKRYLNKNGKVIICKGNHDNILNSVIKDYDFVKLVDYFVLNDVVFLHGDRFSFNNLGLRVFNKNIKYVVVGHFHPAVCIEEKKGGVKKELYRCFLYGRSKELKKNLIILPSFFTLIEGKDVLSSDRLNFLKQMFNINNFNVYVLSGKFNDVLEFGKVKDFL